MLNSLAELNEREQQVVGYLIRGMRDTDICAAMGISRSTLRASIIAEVFRKMGVRNSKEVVGIAVRLQMLAALQSLSNGGRHAAP